MAEAARNVVCSGARPLAVTDCLNFGNPEKLDVYFQLEQAIRGMAAACTAFGTPVVSGNVSLYNETNGDAIYPTPVVGMLGVLEDVEQRLGLGFSRPGELVVLLASPRQPSVPGALRARPATLAGSEYLLLQHGRSPGGLAIDLDEERRVQAVCLQAAEASCISAAHDCSDGGLAVALAESCIEGGRDCDASALAITRPAGCGAVRRAPVAHRGESACRQAARAACAGGRGRGSRGHDRACPGGDRFLLGRADRSAAGGTGGGLQRGAACTPGGPTPA